MKSFQVIVFMAVVLCCCGMVMGQDQPTQPDQQQPQQYAQPEYVQPEYAPQYVLPQVASGPAPVWVIQKRWLGLGGRYKAKPGWLNAGVMAAPVAVQAAPPVITQQVMVPQTITRQVMVPQTVTEQVMVPMQIQRVPKPVITWSPSVQWRY